MWSRRLPLSVHTHDDVVWVGSLELSRDAIHGYGRHSLEVITANRLDGGTARSTDASSPYPTAQAGALVIPGLVSAITGPEASQTAAYETRRSAVTRVIANSGISTVVARCQLGTSSRVIVRSSGVSALMPRSTKPGTVSGRTDRREAAVAGKTRRPPLLQ
jgi:hypothetical protein